MNANGILCVSNEWDIPTEFLIAAILLFSRASIPTPTPITFLRNDARFLDVPPADETVYNAAEGVYTVAGWSPPAGATGRTSGQAIEMRVSLKRTVEYFDTAPDYRIKLGALFRLLQEAAVRHSEQVGFASRSMVESGSVWVLNRMAAEITRYPEYLETVTVQTWHRGCRDFKAYRDFTVHVGDEKVAAASSRWLFYDLQKKRLLRVPGSAAQAYTVEEATALPPELDAWKLDNRFSPAISTEISVRAGDFDPQGHVNNAVYFDYLETLVFSAFKGRRPIRGVRVQFQKEIGPRVEKVTAGLSHGGANPRFKLYSDERLFAGGEVFFREP